jgi:hypothetical protein
LDGVPLLRQLPALSIDFILVNQVGSKVHLACPTDVVCVSTYPPSHEEVALSALNLPLKAILVEKPLGHSAVFGRRILESVKRRNIPMATPHGLMVKRCPLEIIERTQNGNRRVEADRNPIA